jgi:predicted esterase
MRDKRLMLAVGQGVLALCFTFGCGSEGPAAVADGVVLAAEDASGSAQALGQGREARGTLLRSHYLRSLSPEQVRSVLADGDFDSDGVEHGVDLYQLLYQTVDPRDRPSVASGLLALPRSHDRRLLLVSFAHGTEVYKPDAPSVTDDSFMLGPALIYASSGFACAAPDYLGLGAGPGPHPYMHLPTEVSASLDLLRAARSFAALHGRALQRPVFVTGFSQGSFAALGLGRALEQGADRSFQLAALAPISGPYQTRAWIQAALSGDVSQKDATMYFAYLSVAWNRIYGLYRSPSEFFQAPFASYIESLFDNNHEGQEIAMRTPNTPEELLTPAAIARYLSPDPALARPIDELGSVCRDWTTRAPIRLYAASGDEQVPFSNSEACQMALQARGANVDLVDLGDQDHLSSNVRAAGQIARYFGALAR